MSRPSATSTLYRLIEAGQLAHKALLVPLVERGLQAGDDAVLFVLGARNGATPRENQLIVETQGRRGAVFLRNCESRFVSAEPLDVIDPTGAGDTFAGGVIAAIMTGETDLDAMGAAGHASARALLLERKSEESES